MNIVREVLLGVGSAPFWVVVHDGNNNLPKMLEFPSEGTPTYDSLPAAVVAATAALKSPGDRAFVVGTGGPSIVPGFSSVIPMPVYHVWAR